MKYVKIPKSRVKTKVVKGNEYLYYRWMVNGKDKTIYGKTFKELEQKYNDYLNTTGGTKTLDYYFQKYLKEKQSTWKVQTYNSRYNFYKNHVNNSILSNKKISSISKTDVSSFIEKLNLSNSTKKEKLNVLTQFFNWCISKDYTSTNPCKGVTVKMTTFDTDDLNVDTDIIEKILTASKDTEIEAPILLLCYGCRLGEAMASNVKNLGENYIFIKESLTKTTIDGKTKTFLEPPKTKDSIRKVYLAPDDIRRLKHITHSSDGYYCKNINGWYSRNRIYNFLRKYNVKPHQLRKYYTTYLLMNNVNIYTVKRQIGHSKSSPYTERTYLKNSNFIEKEMLNFLNK